MYFILPTCCIAFNAKAGSSTIACAVVRKFYPDIQDKIVKEQQEKLKFFSEDFIKSLPKSFANTELDSFGVWQRICPKTDKPDKLVLLPIRDPIERFRSSITQFELSADQALDALENKTKVPWKNISISLNDNVHFELQSTLIIGDTKLYKFPEQLDQLAIDAGLDLPLPIINKNEKEKPVLSEEQVARVKAYYSEDIKIR